MSEVTTTKQNTRIMDSVRVRRITQTAIMAALTLLMTAYICHIPAANNGYIHFGDSMIYIAAAFLPLPYACAAGAIGGGLADILTGSANWALATIIIKMLICLPFSSKGKTLITKRNVAALFIAFIISSTGYYLAEGIMYGFTVAFFTAIGGSVVQSGGSAIVFVIIGTALDKAGFKTKIANAGK